MTAVTCSRCKVPVEADKVDLPNRCNDPDCPLRKADTAKLLREHPFPERAPIEPVKVDSFNREKAEASARERMKHRRPRRYSNIHGHTNW